MSWRWKTCLLSSVMVGAVACGDDAPAEDTLGEGGLSSMRPPDADAGSAGDAARDAARDARAPRDATTGGGGSDDGGEEPDCSALMARIRDFTPQTSPDFESFSGSGATRGIVAPMLDDNHLPVFAAANGQVTSKASFDQWYRTIAGTNQEIPISIPLTAGSNDQYFYESSSFFPIDGMGFGNYGNSGHNFHFTTQIATSFKYTGGEVFEFEGDDDLWIFVNDRLALDLGGLHSAVRGEIDFDDLAQTLGIQVGGTYRMDIFHAERRTSQSNFKIRTTIACFQPPPFVI